MATSTPASAGPRVSWMPNAMPLSALAEAMSSGRQDARVDRRRGSPW